MKSLRDIKFRTTETKSKLTAGKVCHQGKIIHNQTLTKEETAEAFAEYAKIHKAQATFFLDSLEEFIAKEIADGNRLEFGPFAASLSLRGGFPACNSQFDQDVNELAVELTPSRKIRKAVRELRPINVGHERDGIIFNTMLLPDGPYDRMPADGERRLSCVGTAIEVHPGATGEGVWIENDAGEKLLEGADVEAEFSLCQFTLRGHINPGSYWVVICSRINQTGEFVQARRRITVE